jgi:hypothetical protein
MEWGRGCPLTSLEPRTCDQVLVLGEVFVDKLDQVLDLVEVFFSWTDSFLDLGRGFSRRAKTRTCTRRVVLSPRPTALTAAAFVLNIMWWKSPMAVASPTQNSVVWWAAENAIVRQRGFCHKFILKKYSNLQKGKGVELLCLKFLLGQSNSGGLCSQRAELRFTLIAPLFIQPLLSYSAVKSAPSAYPSPLQWKVLNLIWPVVPTYLQKIFQSMLRSFLSHKQASTIKFYN